MSWSSDLRIEADPIWTAIHTHPFLCELGSGTLDVKRFRYYILQDYPYLKEFCRVLALAVSRGGRLEEMSFFAELLHATLTIEMEMHRSCCRELGISDEEIENARLAPTAYAYSRHLLSVGTLGTQAEMLAALLPCIVSYAEIGAALNAHPPVHAPHYQRWIATYASEPFQEVSRRAQQVMDGLEPSVGSAERERCWAHFVVSSRYEWQFWEMAYRQERWPLEGPGRWA